ncbi:MAG: hypothetical protein WCI74_15255, partial [Actinomycetes bacterium]
MVQPLITTMGADIAAQRPAGATRRANLWWSIGAVFAGAVATLYFYRGFFFSGFQHLQGDSGDGLLTSVISKHWPLLPTSGFGWNDLGFYYPAPDTLGYSDTLLLNGAIQPLFKVVGVDSLLWFQISMVVFTVVGYGCTIAFLRNGPRVPWAVAVPTALVVSFGSGLYVASLHPQLLMFQLLPACALLALMAFRAAPGWRGRVCGLGAGVLL